MSTYTKITLKEMEEVLSSSKGWQKRMTPKSKEYLFVFPLSGHPWIEIQVYSSIGIRGNSRASGRDAIRVFAVDIGKNCGYIKTIRVLRVEGWRKNLQAAVLSVFNDAQKRLQKP